LGALIIMIAAAALRLQYAGTIGQLWRDEIFEIRVAAETETVAESMRIVRDDRWPPLSYLVTRAVDRVFGRDFLVGRWHVLLPAWLTVFFLMLFVRRWFGPGCALLCGLFAATNPFLIHYSAEIRGYALYGLLTVIYFGIYFEFRQKRTWPWAAAWGVAAALLAYCHYFGLFFILVSGLLSLGDRPYRRSWTQATLGAATFLLCFSPWLPALGDALSSGGQHWANGTVELMQIFMPATALLGEDGQWLIWSGIVLGFVAFGRLPKREQQVFLALPIIVVGSAIVGWLVQTQDGRGFTPRYLLGHALMLLPVGLLFWARVGTLGRIAFWRGLHTGRIYRLDMRILGVAGLALVGHAWVLQRQDPDGWVRHHKTPHEEARTLIQEQFQKGDLVVAGSGFQAEGFRYHCEGVFEVLATPHIDGEASTRGKVHVKPAEVERKMARVAHRVEQQIRAGGRVWYYFPASPWNYPIREDGAWNIAPERLSERQEKLRSMHLRILAPLEQNGERRMLKLWAEGYLTCYRLVLYRARGGTNSIASE
ncbi:MAG: glycosyltransferase family 39 protein, partial [Planctomycetota bacterium]